MMDDFRNAFEADVCSNPIEMTRAVEQSGRFQMCVYEQDYRQMTRETLLSSWRENAAQRKD